MNDLQRGGDIDILVISGKVGFNHQIKIKIRNFEDIEEQKVDLVVKNDFNYVSVKMIEPDLQCL